MSEYKDVGHDFHAWVKRETHENEVLISFHDSKAAKAFMEWWRVYYGSEWFAEWCEQQEEYKDLVVTHDED